MAMMVHMHKRLSERRLATAQPKRGLNLDPSS